MIYKFEYDSKEHSDWLVNNSDSIDIIYFKESSGEWTWWKMLSKANEDGLNITHEVNKWLKENNIKTPFQNKENEILFRLRFE